MGCMALGSWTLRSVSLLQGARKVSLLLLLTLGACKATGPEFAARDLEVGDGQARLLVYRVAGGTGMGTWPKLVLATGTPTATYEIGELRHGGFVSWNGAAGHCRLEAQGGFMTWPWRIPQIEVELAGGETVFVELDMDAARTSRLVKCGEDDHNVRVCEVSARSVSAAKMAESTTTCTQSVHI